MPIVEQKRDPIPLDQPSAEVAEIERSRRRVKELECMVSDVVIETHDTATLYLFTGNERLSYQPGHFISIDPHQFESLERWIQFLEDQKGRRETARAYSLASAPHERYLAITVKEERYATGITKYPPLLSPVLVRRMAKGTRMVVTGFAGPYILPPDIEDRTDHLVHICAGSGIVPNMSILKHALETGMKLRHTLVYGNKTWDDVIFQRDLDALAAKYPGKLTIVHALTRDPAARARGANVRAGRVTAQLLRDAVHDWSRCEIFTCGPAITKYERQAARDRGETAAPRFLESTLAALAELGVSKAQIHRESYG
jgi:3-ketosteroid 9alpha-monooxygenase subunit B